MPFSKGDRVVIVVSQDPFTSKTGTIVGDYPTSGGLLWRVHMDGEPPNHMRIYYGSEMRLADAAQP